jgi:hypothetical protein
VKSGPTDLVRRAPTAAAADANAKEERQSAGQPPARSAGN